MVWVKLEDTIDSHPKFLAAGPVAAWLWVCGNAYCNRHLTDGFLPAAAVRKLGGIDHAGKWAATLTAVGLWEKVKGGYRVHDFHDHNPTAAAVKAKRLEVTQVRAHAGRLGGLASAAAKHSKNGSK